MSTSRAVCALRVGDVLILDNEDRATVTESSEMTMIDNIYGKAWLLVWETADGSCSNILSHDVEVRVEEVQP
jgi:hypothetical protein